MRGLLFGVCTSATLAWAGCDSPARPAATQDQAARPETPATAKAATGLTGPIIDMHLHAWSDHPPFGLCIPWNPQFPPKRVGVPWRKTWEEAMMNPPCENPIPSPQGDGAIMRETIVQMERFNVFGVLAGTPETLKQWQAAAPGRFIPGLDFRIPDRQMPVGDLEKLFESGDIQVLGEISNQYAGVAPADERMAPYWALAEKHNIPVAIHMGDGTVGTAFLGFKSLAGYRASLSDALLLEEVLIKYPELRVSVMHYGVPFIDRTIALMNAYPQVYVDIGGIQWAYPRPAFYSQLKALVDAGHTKRIMFGSDQAGWPAVIEPSLRIIDEAPFLTQEQKRDIFYHNAARFLRLSPEEIARHHGTKPHTQ